MIAFIAVGLVSASAFACGGDKSKASKDDQTTASTTKTAENEESGEKTACSCGKSKASCDQHDKQAKKDDSDKTS